MRTCNLEEGKSKLSKALRLAEKMGHEVYIKNYDEGYQREEGDPDYISFDFEAILENGTFNEGRMPEYQGEGGCNEIQITAHDGAERYDYTVLYSDTYEDRVYIGEIDNYLDTWSNTLKEAV